VCVCVQGCGIQKRRARLRKPFFGKVLVAQLRSHVGQSAVDVSTKGAKFRRTARSDPVRVYACRSSLRLNAGYRKFRVAGCCTAASTPQRDACAPCKTNFNKFAVEYAHVWTPPPPSLPPTSSVATRAMSAAGSAATLAITSASTVGQRENVGPTLSTPPSIVPTPRPSLNLPQSTPASPQLTAPVPSPPATVLLGSDNDNDDISQADIDAQWDRLRELQRQRNATTTSTTPAETAGLSLATWIFIAGNGVAFVAFLLAVAWCCSQRRRRSSDTNQAAGNDGARPATLGNGNDGASTHEITRPPASLQTPQTPSQEPFAKPTLAPAPKAGRLANNFTSPIEVNPAFSVPNREIERVPEQRQLQQKQARERGGTASAEPRESHAHAPLPGAVVEADRRPETLRVHNNSHALGVAPLQTRRAAAARGSVGRDIPSRELSSLLKVSAL